MSSKKPVTPSEEDVLNSIHVAFGKPDVDEVKSWLSEGFDKISDFWENAEVCHVPPHQKPACFAVIMEEVLRLGDEYMMRGPGVPFLNVWSIFDWRGETLPPWFKRMKELEAVDDFEYFTNEQAKAIVLWLRFLKSWEAFRDPLDRKSVDERIRDWRSFPKEGPGRDRE